MNLSRYLERIGYSGPRVLTTETLRALHLAHLYSVPFENLDIARHVPIVLDRPALYDKIVLHQRGGFCYEVNGMFAWLLTQLGFDVTLLSARVASQDGTFGPEFDHLTLLVKCPADPEPHIPWLADVGFGDTFRQPLRLDVDGDQPEGSRVYRIESNGGDYLLMQRSGGGNWERQYCFTLQPRAFSDFGEMCRYHQTSPDSHFTRNSMITLALPSGRVTLNPTRLIQTTNDTRVESAVADRAHYDALLLEHFGIQFSEV